MSEEVGDQTKADNYENFCERVYSLMVIRILVTLEVFGFDSSEIFF